MEEKTITEKIQDLTDELNSMRAGKPPKIKKFRIPISSMIQNGKTIKKEWVHVLMIRSNGSIQIKTLKIEDDTVKFGDFFYDARGGNVLRYKKTPMLILKEWNIKPETNPSSHTLDLDKDYIEAAKKGDLTPAQRLILTKLKLELIKPKMKMNIGVILVVLAVIGGGYFLLNSMGVI